MLSKRYKSDGVVAEYLSQFQAEARERFVHKIAQGVYHFETVPCCICNNTEFEQLAAKDRYGLDTSFVICRRCGLVQINPRMNEKSYADFYNCEYRKLYEGETIPPELLFQNQQAHAQRIFNFLKDNKVITKPFSDLLVLEVGCATGGILEFFKQKGCTVKGADLDERCVEFGRLKYGLDLSKGTIADITLSRPADIIIYSHVIEHILDPNRELQMVHRMLSDNGVIYIEVPGIYNVPRCYGDFLLYLQNAHTYHFTLRTLQNLLNLNKFQMTAGDEGINSVFRKSDKTTSRGWVNDYAEVLRFLKTFEMFRAISPISPRKFYKAKEALLLITLNALKYIGLYNLIRDSYRKLRNIPDNAKF